MTDTDLDPREDADMDSPTDEEAPRILPNVTHNRSGWRQGCRCGVCRQDHRADLRERRQAKKEKRKEEQISAAERIEYQNKHFPTMVAVAKQLDSLGAAESNPGIAAIALRMAALLDDPTAQPQQPAAAGKLLDALKELGVRPRQTSTNLASVRDMVNRPIHAVRDSA